MHLQVSELSTQSGIQEELLGRSLQITQRLTTLRTENDEVWKTLETAEKSLMIMINQKDYDVGELFTEDQRPPKSPHEHAKKRSDRLETEAFYLKVKSLNLIVHETAPLARLLPV